MSEIIFGIYIAGYGSRNTVTISAFKEACAQHLPKDCYQIILYDILKNPAEAENKKILAIPTITREKPFPEKRIIGDISETEKARKALQFLTEDLSIPF